MTVLTRERLRSFDPGAVERAGETAYRCPLPGVCADKTKRTLYVNGQTGQWFCHRCGEHDRLQEFWPERARTPKRPSRLGAFAAAPAPVTRGCQPGMPCMVNETAEHEALRKGAERPLGWARAEWAAARVALDRAEREARIDALWEAIDSGRHAGADMGGALSMVARAEIALERQITEAHQ